MSFLEMLSNLQAGGDARDVPVAELFADPRVVGVFHEDEIIEHKTTPQNFEGMTGLPGGKLLARTVLQDAIPKPAENETRMALWLYKYKSPNEQNVWDWVSKVREGSLAEFAKTSVEDKNAHRFLSELLGPIYDVKNMEPYVCFTTDMEAAHTVARIGCTCDYGESEACALLCLVDVPNDLLELSAEETRAGCADASEKSTEATPAGGADAKENPKGPPPDTLACLGLLQWPFQAQYYKKTGGGDPVVGANYDQDRLFACQTYTANMHKFGYKVVHTTQVFMKASVAAQKIHPLCFYTYKQSSVLHETGTWKINQDE